MNEDITITETFVQRLRKNTAELHEALESLPISKKIISPQVTVDEYTTYLSGMQAVVADIEINVFPMLTEVIPDLNDRKKLTMINSDLGYLNKSIPTNQYPITANGFNSNVAFALGVMYVLEGSTLGGRVIYKNISDSLKLDETNGASYSGGYGSTTGSTWKAFLGYFTAYAESCNCEDEIIAGANHAFGAIKEYLSKA